MYEIIAYHGSRRYPNRKFMGYSKKEAIACYRAEFNLKYKKLDLFIERLRAM